MGTIIILMIVIISLSDATVNITSSQIELCLNDSAVYSCEIQSLSSTLTWRITYPGNNISLSFTYNSNSSLNILSPLNDDIMVILVDFNTTEMYIEAGLFITIQENNINTLNGTMLECIGDFDSNSTVINNVVGKYKTV